MQVLFLLLLGMMKLQTANMQQGCVTTGISISSFKLKELFSSFLKKNEPPCKNDEGGVLIRVMKVASMSCDTGVNKEGIVTKNKSKREIF